MIDDLGLRRLLVGRAGGKPRQIDFHRRTFTDFAVDFDVTAALFDEAIDLAQPQPGALAGVLGSEERLERAGENLAAHAGAGIADRNLHILAGADVRILTAIFLVQVGVVRLYGELAAVRHRVAGIHRKIEDRGFQLGRIRFDRPKAAGADDLNRYRLAQAA